MMVYLLSTVQEIEKVHEIFENYIDDVQETTSIYKSY